MVSCCGKNVYINVNKNREEEPSSAWADFPKQFQVMNDENIGKPCKLWFIEYPDQFRQSQDSHLVLSLNDPLSCNYLN